MKLEVTLPLEPPVFSGLVPGASSIPVPSLATETAIATALAALLPPIVLTPAQVGQLIAQLALTQTFTGGFSLTLSGIPIGSVSATTLTPYTGAMISAENR